MLARIDLIHVLPASVRRGYDRREASSYVGLSPGTFDKLVQTGQMPQPMTLAGRKVWDRLSLDHALDRLSGVGHHAQADEQVTIEDQLDSELAAFEAKHYG